MSYLSTLHTVGLPSVCPCTLIRAQCVVPPLWILAFCYSSNFVWKTEVNSKHKSLYVTVDTLFWIWWQKCLNLCIYIIGHFKLIAFRLFYCLWVLNEIKFLKFRKVCQGVFIILKTKPLNLPISILKQS